MLARAIQANESARNHALLPHQLRQHQQTPVGEIVRRNAKMALSWSLATALLAVGILLAIPTDATPLPDQADPFAHYASAAFANWVSLALGVALMALAGVWIYRLNRPLNFWNTAVIVLCLIALVALGVMAWESALHELRN